MGDMGDLNAEGWRKKRDGRRIAPEARQVYSKSSFQDVKPQRGSTDRTGRAIEILKGEDGKIV